MSYPMPLLFAEPWPETPRELAGRRRRRERERRLMHAIGCAIERAGIPLIDDRRRDSRMPMLAHLTDSRRPLAKLRATSPSQVRSWTRRAAGLDPETVRAVLERSR